MDPITDAVVAALGKLAEPVVKDAYEALKTLIIRRFGAHSELTKAVATLEARPDSKARQEVLAEEMTTSDAVRDRELLRLAEALAANVRGAMVGTQTVSQHVHGDKNAVSGTGDITINIGGSGTAGPR
jgi:hypothetical protein